MMLKQLGQTGIRIPEIGLGTWDYHAGAAPLRKGLDAGALFVDTAESYGTEEVVGEAVAGMRERVFIATKVSARNFRADVVRRSVDASLRRMKLECIDLVQLHEPNPAVPVQETMGALSDLVDAGKIRYVGVSNFSVVQLMEAERALSKHPVVSNQVRYNLIDRTIEVNGLLEYCQTRGITVIAYSPLGRSFSRVRDCDPSGVIDEVAVAVGRTPAQIVLNWCLTHDAVVAIPKSNSERHILQNCGASDWRLTDDQLRSINNKVRRRHRTAFDAWIRRAMPNSFRSVAGRAVNALPRSLRRRIH
jgi:diketogulonate reductase-like aldo/keto reductase